MDIPRELILPSRRAFALSDGDDGIANVRRAYGQPISDAEAAWNERNRRYADAYKSKPDLPLSSKSEPADANHDADDDPARITLDDARARAADAIEQRNERLRNAWRQR